MTKRGRGQRRSRRLKNRERPYLRRWLIAPGLDWAAVYVAFNCEPRQMGVA